MGLDDIVAGAKGLLATEQGENISDTVLDAVANTASKVTGGKFDEQIGSARDAADQQVGTE